MTFEMTLDSKTFVNPRGLLNKQMYLTSDPQENDWGGQLPVSRQTFQPGLADLIDGIYVAAKPPEVIFSFEPELENEFAAWEAASDEALLNFESTLE
jgi:hypothetical protein